MIYLTRHGQTEFNAVRRAQGALDSNLTDLGQRQAVKMGELLGTLVADPQGCPIHCSPQGRAMHTARLIQGAMGNRTEIIPDPRLREVGMGQWDGRTYAEIEAGWPGTLAKGQGWYFDSPDGDRFEDMRSRISDWLESVKGRPGELIAVSHGVAGRILRGLFAELPHHETLDLPTPQDAIYRLDGGRIEQIACAPA